MTFPRLGALAALVLLNTAACHNPAPEPEPEVSAPVTVSPSASPSAPTGTVTDQPDDQGYFIFPTGTYYQGAYYTTVVERFEPARVVSDGTIETLLVKTCVETLPSEHPDGVGFSANQYTLELADGSMLPPAQGQFDLKESAYPRDYDMLLQPGDCVEGLIQFEHVAQEAVHATFSADERILAQWTL